MHYGNMPGVAYLAGAQENQSVKSPVSNCLESTLEPAPSEVHANASA